jgi:hypothetical protein
MKTVWINLKARTLVALVIDDSYWSFKLAGVQVGLMLSGFVQPGLIHTQHACPVG